MVMNVIKIEKYQRALNLRLSALWYLIGVYIHTSHTYIPTYTHTETHRYTYTQPHTSTIGYVYTGLWCKSYFVLWVPLREVWQSLVQRNWLIVSYAISLYSLEQEQLIKVNSCPVVWITIYCSTCRGKPCVITQTNEPTAVIIPKYLLYLG